MTKHKIYSMSVASIDLHCIAEAEKGRSKDELDEIMRWFTGYSQAALECELEKKTSFEESFAQAVLRWKSARSGTDWRRP